ncbi:hypothetical protein IIA79_00150 [bacterium]|nr:hypothetical protein [bacterium]
MDRSNHLFPILFHEQYSFFCRWILAAIAPEGTHKDCRGSCVIDAITYPLDFDADDLASEVQRALGGDIIEPDWNPASD